MLVLFDHSTPAPLSSYLVGHTVIEARARGWDRLSNGDLLVEAERAGFEALVTADKNMRYQQNLKGRKIALVVLGTPRWPALRMSCGSYRRCRQRRHARQLRGSRNTQNIGRPQVTEEVSGQETDKPGRGNTTILDRWRGATVQKEADAAFGYAIAETQASHAKLQPWK